MTGTEGHTSLPLYSKKNPMYTGKSCKGSPKMTTGLGPEKKNYNKNKKRLMMKIARNKSRHVLPNQHTYIKFFVIGWPCSLFIAKSKLRSQLINTDTTV